MPVVTEVTCTAVHALLMGEPVIGISYPITQHADTHLCRVGVW